MGDSISERSSKLFQILTGRSTKSDRYRLFNYEPFIDLLCAFLDINCTVEIQRKEKHVANFVKKYKSVIDEVRKLRVTRDDFDLIKIIGRGHFGEVYVVREKNTNDVYAMKILKKAATLSNDNVAFYEEERDIMALAASEWVITLQYAFQDCENLYLVMEYLPGGDLLNLISRYPEEIMDEEDAKFYICEIILAVHAVHVAGYVHRDVKPENILIDRTGHVKLADFGSAAKLLNGRTVMCKMPVGTPEYIAPEVLQSMNSGGGIYGCECDWWSVGVLCYEILVGQLPFEAEGVLKLYSSIMNFKTSLEFPDDVPVSESAKSVMLMLLEDQKARAGYEQLANHEFFKGMDWTTLKSCKPPFIPAIKDALDTSNFTEIKPTRDAKRPIAPSLSNTVPFIGYTFTRNIHTNVQTLNKQSSNRSTNMSTADDFDRSKEISRLTMLNETLNTNVASLTSTVSEGEKKIKKIEAELNSLLEESKTKSIKINSLDEQLKSTQTEKNQLQQKLAEISEEGENVDEIKNRLKVVEASIEVEKDTVRKLGSEKEAIRVQAASLKVDLESAQKKLKDSEVYWKEYEANQTKYQAELKQSLAEVQKLLESTTEDYKTQQANMREEIKKYREMCETLEKQKFEIKQQQEQDSIMLSNQEINVLNTKLSQTVEKYESLKKQFHELEDAAKEKENELKAREISTIWLNQTVKSLENTINEMTSKIKDLEKMNEDYDCEIIDLKAKSEGLSSANFNLQVSLEQAQQKIAELDETNTKLELEYQIERRKRAEKSAQLETELENMKNNINEKNLTVSKLESDLTVQKTAFVEKEAEINRLDLEITRLNSVISAQKTSNFNLSQELEHAKYQIDRLENENEEILANSNRVEAKNREQIYKFQETIAQQTKLINFLHKDSPKKKSKRSDHDSQTDTLFTSHSVRRVRDVEQQLELERNQTLRLNNELAQARAELLKFKQGLKKQSSVKFCSSTLISANPEKMQSVTSLSSSEIVEVRDHDLSPSFCYTPVLCAMCLGPIAFLKPVMTCQGCRMIMHPNCVDYLTTKVCTEIPMLKDVDLAIDPCELAKMFFDKRLSVSKRTESITNSLIKNSYSGFLSVTVQVGHNKFDWHKLNFELVDSVLSVKNMESDENTASGTIDFSKIHDCKILSTIHTSDLAFTPLSNAPFVFGLELPGDITQDVWKSFNFTDTALELKPAVSNIFLLLAPTLEEKRSWISNLTKVIEPGPINPPKEVLVNFNSKMTPNVCCAAILSNTTILVGHREGINLIDTIEKVNLLCTEPGTQCHSLLYITPYLFGIFGGNRELCRIKRPKSKSLKDFSHKHKLSVAPCPNLNNIVSMFRGENASDPVNIFVCTEECLISLKVTDTVTQNFKFNFGEIPPSALTVCNNQLIVCQDKFYSIDMATKSKRDFLDKEDHSLAFVVFGSTETANYPMNVFKLTGTSQPKFLMCCSEFGFVVNLQGQRAIKNDIRWDSIPLEFAFKNNVLYVFYHDRVEKRQFDASLTDLNDIVGVTVCHLSLPRFMFFTPADDIVIASFKPDSSITFYCIMSGFSKTRRDTMPASRNDHSNSSGASDHGSHRPFSSFFNKKRK